MPDDTTPVAPDEQGPSLLTLVMLDRQDVRDGYLARTYTALLGDAFATVGIHSAPPFTERAAKTILERANRMAMKTIYDNAGTSARSAADVLRQAAKARTGK